MTTRIKSVYAIRRPDTKAFFLITAWSLKEASRLAGCLVNWGHLGPSAEGVRVSRFRGNPLRHRVIPRRLIYLKLVQVALGRHSIQRQS